MKIRESRTIRRADKHCKMASPMPPEHRRIIEPQEPRRKNEQEPPLPEGVFSVIYADPPWRYNRGIGIQAAVEAQYPTMTIDDICKLGWEIEPHLADDAILFLWATTARLPDAFKVITAWGFTYVSSSIWDKNQSGGIGYYFKGRHEFLLVGKRGTPPTPVPKQRPESIFVEKKRGHSRKPEKAYEIIEQMYPHGKYLELFSRNRRPGWTMWGINEA